MGGGMEEWVLDWFGDAWYAEAGNPCNDCANLEAGLFRISRGGSWATSSQRAAARAGETPETRRSWRGFRCARDTP
jgi:formylglycine-generating enzyme required for sulfatase activity